MERPARNLLFLYLRYLRTELASAERTLGLPGSLGADSVEDIRDLTREGCEKLASAHVLYTSNVPKMRVGGFRMWGPRRAFEEARPEGQWYVPADLFEEFLIPQIELRFILDSEHGTVDYSQTGRDGGSAASKMRPALAFEYSGNGGSREEGRQQHGHGCASSVVNCANSWR